MNAAADADRILIYSTHWLQPCLRDGREKLTAEAQSAQSFRREDQETFLSLTSHAAEGLEAAIDGNDDASHE